MNDLWKYDPMTNEWELIKGNRWPISGIYGIQGVPDPDNVPGSRAKTNSWKGPDGALYLFGGDGYDESGKCGPRSGFMLY